MQDIGSPKIRETTERELPIYENSSTKGYRIYPSHKTTDNVIFVGYDSLAKSVSKHPVLFIDGYIGVRFEEIRTKLNESLKKLDIQVNWIDLHKSLKSEEKIDEMIAPYLGGDDPIFGHITSLSLMDFYDESSLQSLKNEEKSGVLNIYYGCGASLLCNENAPLLYLDISKNEIQFRARAGSITNLGASSTSSNKKMYKRFYFVDWIVLNKHKESIISQIDYYVDAQRSNDITWMHGSQWRKDLQSLVRKSFRVRPWFEPGAWGGQWIKEKIDGLNEDAINYAWSFELIVPENGVLLESSSILLETSFDCLMYQFGNSILGKDYDTFGANFPIRFDFLDTFEGGNLSIQCHPRIDFMRKHFGEAITQEETYYILDNTDDAQVYLGFQEDIDPQEFQQALQQSAIDGSEIEIENYVQKFPSEKHGLYLIPPGTIHGSGTNNLVLEISSTPYIYTFKMYDWLRLDLDGKPRPLNIERGMENLDFSRSGKKVIDELIAKPIVLEEKNGHCVEHLKTHPEHLYDVHRLRLDPGATLDNNTKNQCHILSLVEGTEVEVTLQDELSVYRYAETFVLPADVKTYLLHNPTNEVIMLVKAFIK